MIICCSMGRSSWRLQEVLLLDQLRDTDRGRDLLASNGTKWWANARNWFAAEYLKEFRDVCFEAETDAEFEQRKKVQPRGELQRFGAETDDDRQARVSKVPNVSMMVVARDWTLSMSRWPHSASGHGSRV